MKKSKSLDMLNIRNGTPTPEQLEVGQRIAQAIEDAKRMGLHVSTLFKDYQYLLLTDTNKSQISIRY